MSISHHLDDATLMALASGTLDEAFATVALAHVDWCDQCRAALQKSEAIGGAALEELAPEPVDNDALAATLARLDDADDDAGPVAAEETVVDLSAPGPLARLLGRPLAEVKWKKLPGGIATCELPTSAGVKSRLRLLKIGPGRSIPEHGHRGNELTLILAGSYTDAFGRFGRGDIADVDATVAHRPVINPGEDCICLVASEAPMKFHSLIPKLLQPLMRI